MYYRSVGSFGSIHSEQNFPSISTTFYIQALYVWHISGTINISEYCLYSWQSCQSLHMDLPTNFSEGEHSETSLIRWILSKLEQNIIHLKYVSVIYNTVAVSCLQSCQLSKACLRNPQDIYIVNQLLLCLTVRKLEEPKTRIVHSWYTCSMFFYRLYI